MIIDINMLWLPEDLFTDKSLQDSFLRMIPSTYGVHARLDTIPGTNRQQVIVEKPKGYPNLNYSHLFADTAKRLAAMDEGGVDKGILRLPCAEEWIDLEMARKFNDIAAKTVREHPDRLLALAFVPPWGDSACLYELDRCVKELGCCGVEMAAHYGTLYLDEPEFRPYFKRLNDLNVPICVHHTPLPVDYGSIYKYNNVRRGFGRFIDQMTSVSRILYSGMLEEFPNLKFIFTMLGGCFYAFTEFITPHKPKVKVDIERGDWTLVEKVRGYMKENIYFDMCHAQPWGKDHLEFAIKVSGADHVLYSSSYPARIESCVQGVDFVNNLDISEKDKKLVLGVNAQKLFRIS